MRKLASLLCLTFLPALSACDKDEPSAAEGVQDDRQPLGKSDNVGSCEAACGGPSSGTCWCDEACATFGDCCVDYEEQCGGGATTGAATCESLGGQCKIPSPDGCGAEAELVQGVTCELPNDFCCVPTTSSTTGGDGGATGDSGGGETGGGETGGGDSGGGETGGGTPTCESLGGQCTLPSPDGCGANDLVEASCELANDFCCVPPGSAY